MVENETDKAMFLPGGPKVSQFFEASQGMGSVDNKLQMLKQRLNIAYCWGRSYWKPMLRLTIIF